MLVLEINTIATYLRTTRSTYLYLWTGLIMLISLFYFFFYIFLFIPCDRLSWLSVSFLLHVK